MLSGVQGRNRTADTRLPIEGGLFTTVADYGKILLMHLRGGLCGDTRVLSEAAVERMQVDRVLAYGDTEAQMRASMMGADPDTLDAALELSGYGMGWWINRTTGVLVDPGAYGATAWLDVERGAGGLIAVEGALRTSAEMVVAGVFDKVEQAFEAGEAP